MSQMKPTLDCPVALHLGDLQFYKLGPIKQALLGHADDYVSLSTGAYSIKPARELQSQIHQHLTKNERCQEPFRNFSRIVKEMMPNVHFSFAKETLNIVSRARVIFNNSYQSELLYNSNIHYDNYFFVDTRITQVTFLYVPEDNPLKIYLYFWGTTRLVAHENIIGMSSFADMNNGLATLVPTEIALTYKTHEILNDLKVVIGGPDYEGPHYTGDEIL